MKRGLTRGADGVVRCAWPGDHDDYRSYHDDEWGRPVADDRGLFEKVCLEGFQAGLSWLTILRKRENFRRAFRDFDPDALARLGRRSVPRLMADPGIVRHRGKIEATLHNAKRALELRTEFGSLAAFFWQFEPSEQERPRTLDFASFRKLTRSPASLAMSRGLKERDWRFVGPTTCYSLMQALGIVNDHLEGCAIRATVEGERRRLRRPAPPGQRSAARTSRRR